MTTWPRKNPDVGELAIDLLQGAVLYHEHYGWERGGGAEPVCRVDYDPVLIAQSGLMLVYERLCFAIYISTALGMPILLRGWSRVLKSMGAFSSIQILVELILLLLIQP